jgi:nucleotide-binding universal stress UspA family protein
MLFQHLIVLLDGSRLAEAALSPTVYLAKTLGAKVTLVHVIESNPPERIHGERHLSNPQEALTYLCDVTTRAFPADMEVRQHVHSHAVHDVAKSIAEHAGELDSDLIVMCTHGRGGLRDWILGSMAQQVIGQGNTPVFLIRPNREGRSPEFKCEKILVSLDADPEHEKGLAISRELAQAFHASLHLVMVVHTRSTLSGERAVSARTLPGTISVLLDLKEKEAAEYLAEHLSQLEASGLTITAEVQRGDPAKVLLQVSENIRADMIVLGTHGKTGLEAFWSGSITPKLSSHSLSPLLLVPVRE